MTFSGALPPLRVLKAGCKQFQLNGSHKIIKLNLTQVEEQGRACASHLSTSDHGSEAALLRVCFSFINL